MYSLGADRALGNVTKCWARPMWFRLASINESKERGTLKPASIACTGVDAWLIHQITALIESNFALNGISSNVINIAVRDKYGGPVDLILCSQTEGATRHLICPDNRAFGCQWSSDTKLRKQLWKVDLGGD